MSLRPFHLAVTVHDLNAAKSFYGELLSCTEGRTASRWVDYDFFGHQLTVHLDERKALSQAANDVDKRRVPVPHFGVILDWSQWEQLAQHLQKQTVQWVIEPNIRFQGQAGEQGTFFLQDPSGNVLEFKAFQSDASIFATS